MEAGKGSGVRGVTLSDVLHWCVLPTQHPAPQVGTVDGEVSHVAEVHPQPGGFCIVCHSEGSEAVQVRPPDSSPSVR